MTDKNAQSRDARALEAIRKLQEQLQLLKREPIAVVGMGCRFPSGADTPERFFQNLLAKVDSTREIPSSRWNVDAFYAADAGAPGKMITRRGAFLDDIDAFDPTFFGIAPREAASLDPQQRVLLEVVTEAFESAGLRRESLGNAAVFMGVMGWDYFLRSLGVIATSEEARYIGTGTVHSIISNRISYTFDLKGPSMTIDTACSSSLVALHLACETLRRREAPIALAGGVNLMLSPEFYIALSKAGMLAPDGRCKTFDAAANGYVRGEGCGVVVLKRLSDAIADGDRVLAQIRGTAVNQDGQTSAITAPNPKSQEAVMRAALEVAAVAPERVSYIEAHGTGTPLGDPIEIESITRVYGQRPAGEMLAIGSVKTNIGHLESAAGVASLIKVVSALRTRTFPPSLNFDKPNPLIPFDEIPIRVQTEAAAWNATGSRIAGISAFSFGGTNAHALVEEAPTEDVAKWTEADARAARGEPNVLAISAKNEPALAARIQQLASFLEGESLDGTWRDTAYTATVRRDHLEHRACVVGGSAKELAERLRSGSIVKGRTHERRPKVAFVFAGQGSQWWAMGRELFAEESVFRAAIEEVSAVVHERAGWSLVDRLLAPETSSQLHQTETAQPALFAVEIALAALLRSWGIVPDAVAGHSVGEIAAAHVAGALSLAQAAELAVIRGRIMQKATGLGSMAHVELPANEVSRLLADQQGRLFIGAVNGPAQTVVSGESEAIEAFLQRLAEQKIFAKKLQVDYAFHTERLAPLGAELSAALASLTPSATSTPFVSTVTGAVAAGPSLDSAYWGRQIVKPVAFHDATRALLAAGHDVLLEIGPHPVLAQSMVETVGTSQATARVVSTLKRKEPERAAILAAAASLHCAGAPVLWEKTFQPRGRVVSIPHYPWQRQRFWVEEGQQVARTSPSGQLHPLVDAHVELATQPGTHLFDASISVERHPWLADHVVAGAVVAPGAFYVASAIAAARVVHGDRVLGVEDVRFPKLLSLSNGARRIQISLEPTRDALQFELRSRDVDGEGAWELNAEGRIALGDPTTGQPPKATEPPSTVTPEPLAASTLYERFARIVSIDFGATFRCLVDTTTWNDGASASIALRNDIATQCTPFGLHPIVVDACFQAVGAALLASESGHAYLPSGIGAFRVHGSTPDARTIRVALREGARDERVVADVVVLDADGAIVIEASELVFTRFVRAGAALGDAPRAPRQDALSHARRAPAPGAHVTLDRGLHRMELARPSAGARSARTWLLAATIASARRVFGDGAALRELEVTPREDSSGGMLARVTIEEPTATTPSLPGRLRIDVDDTQRAVSARASASDATDAPAFDRSAIESRCTKVDAPAEIDARLARVGVASPRRIDQARHGASELVALLSSGRPADGATREIAAVDAGLQTMALASPSGRAASGPIVADVLHVWGDPSRTEWIHLAQTLRAEDGLPSCTVTWIDASGRALLQLVGAALGDADDDRLLAVAWEQLSVADGAGDATGTWLVLADRQIAPQLVRNFESAGGSCIVVTPGTKLTRLETRRYEIAPDARGELGAVLDEALPQGQALRGVIHLWTLDAPALPEDGFVADGAADDTTARILRAQTLGPIATLEIVRVLGERNLDARVWLVTRGAQRLDGDHTAVAFAQASLWGFGATLAHEHPALSPSLVDLDGGASVANNATSLAMEILRREDGSAPEPRIAIRSERAWGARLERLGAFGQPRVPLAVTKARGYELEKVDRAGGTFRLRQATVSMPARGQIGLRLRATHGTTALAGVTATVSSVGADVSDLTVGDNVVAWTTHGFDSHASIDARLAARIPKGLDPVDAATIPTVGAAALYAVDHVARLVAEEIVLVCDDGLLGLALTKCAQRRGARVVVAASSDDARGRFEPLGVEIIVASSSATMKESLDRLTSGRGLDAVIGAPRGEIRDVLLEAVTPTGRFVDLQGDSDRVSDATFFARAQRLGVTLLVADLATLLERRPERAAAVLRDAVALVASRELKLPSPSTTSFSQLADDQGALVGSRGEVTVEAADGVLVCASPRHHVDPSGTYLVTGGLGGIGLVTASRLVESGARRIVLVGRSAPSAAAAEAIARMQSVGAEVVVERVDVTDAGAVAGLVSRAHANAPLRGIFHAAGVLEDATLTSLTPAQVVGSVFTTKVLGAWNLHRACSEIDLDAFVLFASITGVLGKTGQANYAAANAVLDSFADYRRALGLAATSIAWGLWAEVGMAARSGSTESIASSGALPMRPDEGADLLEAVLQRGVSRACAARLDVERYLDVHPTFAGTPWFGRLTARERAEAPAASSLHAKLSAMTPKERTAFIGTVIRERLSVVLRLAASEISERTPFFQMGVDSVMLIEIRLGLERELGIPVSTIELINQPSVEQLTARLLELTLGAAAAADMIPAAAPEPAPVPDVDLSDLGDLGGASAEEIAALLDDD